MIEVIRDDITKKEIMEYEKYFVMPKFLMEMFKDEDIIPKELVKIMFILPKPEPYIIFTSPKVYEELIKAFNNSINDRREI